MGFRSQTDCMSFWNVQNTPLATFLFGISNHWRRSRNLLIASHTTEKLLVCKAADSRIKRPHTRTGRRKPAEVSRHVMYGNVKCIVGILAGGLLEMIWLLCLICFSCFVCLTCLTSFRCLACFPRLAWWRRALHFWQARSTRIVGINKRYHMPCQLCQTKAEKHRHCVKCE